MYHLLEIMAEEIVIGAYIWVDVRQANLLTVEVMSAARMIITWPNGSPARPAFWRYY